MVFKKQLADTDAQYCLKPTSSNQSSIFLGDSTQAEFEGLFGVGFSSATEVNLSVNKKNLAINILAHFFDQTTWYDRKSGQVLELDKPWVEDRIAELDAFFGDSSDMIVSGAGLNKEESGNKRLYIKGLFKLVNGSNELDLRNYLFSSDVLELVSLNSGCVQLRVLLPDGPLAEYVKKNFVFSAECFKKEYGQKMSALQRITYGAPGTGKSWGIEELVKTIPDRVFRTTFHPDSDYSTFVGAYKPTMDDVPWYYIDKGKKACVLDEKNQPVKERKIVYKFVAQAFTNAYVNAWKAQSAAIAAGAESAEAIYLVIEEINRGNCAQVFGDIFQLLDRKDGYSQYPIKANEDLSRYLAEAFHGLDFGEEYKKVQLGEELVLPNNLYIWATMNTSDQSLFPMDSAFKRRWDWKYVPIKDEGLKWKIKFADCEVDWWKFLVAINKVVKGATNSADKKLGYFFVKAKDAVIDAEMFVNKVAFYLWNDVFKDCELDGEAFKIARTNDVVDVLAFQDFFKDDGTIDEAVLKNFLTKLVPPAEAVPVNDGAAPSAGSAS